MLCSRNILPDEINIYLCYILIKNKPRNEKKFIICGSDMFSTDVL